MTDAAFELRGVEKHFGALRALGPISLSVPSGQRVAVVGPSGAGKTTLLNLLARSLSPDQGTIALYGHITTELDDRRERAALVGMMHQQLDLVPNLAVVHNVLAGRLGQWGILRSALSLLLPQDVPMVEDALGRVGIGDKLHERTSRLSGGEQQRVALARLLVQDPRAFLLDEPVSSLDPARSDEVLRLVMSLAAEGDHTVVASLHAVPLALAFFDRILALRAGAVVFDRPSDTVLPADLEALYDLEGPTEPPPAAHRDQPRTPAEVR